MLLHSLEFPELWQQSGFWLGSNTNLLTYYNHTRDQSHVDFGSSRHAEAHVSHCFMTAVCCQVKHFITRSNPTTTEILVSKQRQPQKQCLVQTKCL